MKTVTVGLRSKNINGEEVVHNNVSFNLDKEKEAEGLYTLFTYVQSGMVSIFSPELSGSQKPVKENIAKMIVRIESDDVADLDNINPWGDAVGKYEITFDATPENLKFLGLLMKLTNNKAVISSLSTEYKHK